MTEAELFRAPLVYTRADPATDAEGFVWQPDGGVLVGNRRIVASGDFADVRRQAPDAPVTDWRDGFIVPGFVDTHVHYPQLRVIGAFGRSLLDWLEHAALPEEVRMGDVSYAIDTARRFVDALATHGTTTALVFGAHFAAATAALFESGAARGLRIASGLIVADRVLRPELHQSVDEAYRESTALIRRFHGVNRALYAITPRFALSSSEAMLEMCQSLSREHPTVRIQSHINENPEEIAQVRAAFPWASDYLGVYERYSLIGSRTVLAHDVHPTSAELERLAATETSVAHCPASNAALGSGIFPMRRHLEAGVHVSLGTDVGGGTGFGMVKEALCAYLMQRVTPDGAALDPRRMLYLATLAGAEALGLEQEIGSLCPGKAADFVFVRPPADSVLAAVLARASSVDEMLGAVFALAGAESVRDVRVDGRQVHAA